MQNCTCRDPRVVQGLMDLNLAFLDQYGDKIFLFGVFSLSLFLPYVC